MLTFSLGPVSTLTNTRMADHPANGVVDAECQVHGVRGLYVAGSSVFPTVSHANPTQMIVALAVRLADTLKGVASAHQNDSAILGRIKGRDRPHLAVSCQAV
jgi:choline dehydrogenase-like flavoprotein